MKGGAPFLPHLPHSLYEVNWDHFYIITLERRCCILKTSFSKNICERVKKVRCVDPTIMCCCLKIEEVDTKKLFQIHTSTNTRAGQKDSVSTFFFLKAGKIFCSVAFHFPSPHFSTSSINPSEKNHVSVVRVQSPSKSRVSVHYLYTLQILMANQKVSI